MAVEVLKVSLLEWLGQSQKASTKPQETPPSAPATSPTRPVRHFSLSEREEAFQRALRGRFAQDLNFRTR